MRDIEKTLALKIKTTTDSASGKSQRPGTNVQCSPCSSEWMSRLYHHLTEELNKRLSLGSKKTTTRLSNS